MKLAETTKLMDEHIFAKYRAGADLHSGALMQGQLRYISMIAESVDESERRLRELAKRMGASVILTEFEGGGPQMRRIDGWRDRFSSVNGAGGMRVYLVEMSGAVARMWAAVDDLRDVGLDIAPLPLPPRGEWIIECETALDTATHFNFLPMLANALDALDDAILGAKIPTAPAAPVEAPVSPVGEVIAAAEAKEPRKKLHLRLGGKGA